MVVEDREKCLGETLKQTLQALKLENRGKLSSSKCKEYTPISNESQPKISRLTKEKALEIFLRHILMYLTQMLQKEAGKRKRALNF